MSPEDPRHGQYAGAVAHWFDGERPCDDCARAEWRYRKTRKLRHLRGDAPMVASVGTVRRYQALMALGYTGPQIAAECGVSVNSLRSIGYHGSALIRRGTALAVAEAYDRLCMTRPDGRYADRARSIAKSRGWLPPLAWDDIDDPDEHPDMTAVDNLPDRIVVERILAGDFTLRPTKAERWEVIARWPGTDAELERWTGWNIARDRREMRSEVAA